MVPRGQWLAFSHLVASQQVGDGMEASSGTSGWGLGNWGCRQVSGLGLCSATQVPHVLSPWCSCLQALKMGGAKGSSTETVFRPSWFLQRCQSAHGERAQMQGGVERLVVAGSPVGPRLCGEVG